MQPKSRAGRALRAMPHGEHVEESIERSRRKVSDSKVAEYGVRRNPHFVEPALGPRRRKPKSRA